MEKIIKVTLETEEEAEILYWLMNGCTKPFVYNEQTFDIMSWTLLKNEIKIKSVLREKVDL